MGLTEICSTSGSFFVDLYRRSWSPVAGQDHRSTRNCGGPACCPGARSRSGVSGWSVVDTRAVWRCGRQAAALRAPGEDRRPLRARSSSSGDLPRSPVGVSCARSGASRASRTRLPAPAERGSHRQPGRRPFRLACARRGRLAPRRRWPMASGSRRRCAPQPRGWPSSFGRLPSTAGREPRQARRQPGGRTRPTTSGQGLSAATRGGCRGPRRRRSWPARRSRPSVTSSL